tara:strand:- start:339 stop:590 length:252 start_codon:yes stop_codon:yes gene_type:complete
MPNYRLSIDLSDLQNDLKNYVLTGEYSIPFSLCFVDAASPDDACHEITIRLMRKLMRQKPTIETRIICRKIRKFIRVDKIEIL